MSFQSVSHARALAIFPATAPGWPCVLRLDKLGVIKIPNFYGSDSHYRPCLQEYYADWAPEKLGTLDETLLKWEGKVCVCVRTRWRCGCLCSPHERHPPAGKVTVCQAQQKVQKTGAGWQVPGPTQNPVKALNFCSVKCCSPWSGKGAADIIVHTSRRIFSP